MPSRNTTSAMSQISTLAEVMSHCPLLAPLRSQPEELEQEIKEVTNLIDQQFACYAGLLHMRHSADLGHVAMPGYAEHFDQPELLPGRMMEAAHWSDLFGRKRLHKPCLDGLSRIIVFGDQGEWLSSGTPLDRLQEEVIENLDFAQRRPAHLAVVNT